MLHACHIFFIRGKHPKYKSRVTGYAHQGLQSPYREELMDTTQIIRDSTYARQLQYEDRCPQKTTDIHTLKQTMRDAILARKLSKCDSLYDVWLHTSRCMNTSMYIYCIIYIYITMNQKIYFYLYHSVPEHVVRMGGQTFPHAIEVTINLGHGLRVETTLFWVRVIVVFLK